MTMTQSNDQYQPNGLFRNGHFNTVYTNLFCRVPELPYVRERISHPKGFSLYLDWMRQDNNRLVIFSHGLESSSHARYIRAMGHEFIKAEYDVLAWNLRNCAEGEPYEENAHYHSGVSEDLELVVNHVLDTCDYDEIVMVGFSLGGNIMLKYLGEKGDELPAVISRAMAVSTPVDLLSCSYVLLDFPNTIYTRSFMKSLREKALRQRHSIEAMGLEVEPLLHCRNLREFDELFTAPVHGFRDQDDYYMKASALPLLPKIRIPTLYLNAWDDPMLTLACYPEDEHINNPLITTMYTRYGGHVGYYSPGKKDIGWLENMALRFLSGEDMDSAVAA